MMLGLRKDKKDEDAGKVLMYDPCCYDGGFILKNKLPHCLHGKILS